MASFGALVGFLNLDDAQYQRALKAVESRTRAFASGLSSKFLAIAGPTALAAGLVTLGKRALDTADRFDNLATRINASFEGVQVLETLGKDFGNNADMFTAAGDKIQQALAEIAGGNTKAAATFTALGLSADHLQGLQLERQLEILARAVVGATDQQAAFLAVSELIGLKAAPQLKAALISLGTDGYEVLRQKTVESVGLMTEEQGKQLAQAKRQIEDFGDTLTLFEARFLAWSVSGISGLKAALNIGLSDFEKAQKAFNKALAIDVIAPETLLAQVRTMSAALIAEGSKADAAQINQTLGSLAITREALSEKGRLTESANQLIIQRERDLEAMLQVILDKRNAAEAKAAADRVIINQKAADAIAQQQSDQRAQGARTMRIGQILDAAFSRAEDGAKETADQTERAATAAGLMAAGFDAAANNAARITLPGGSRPDTPRGPTPPNPQGSGMTNAEWKDYNRSNPSVARAFVQQQSTGTIYRGNVADSILAANQRALDLSDRARQDVSVRGFTPPPIIRSNAEALARTNGVITESLTGSTVATDDEAKNPLADLIARVDKLVIAINGVADRLVVGTAGSSNGK